MLLPESQRLLKANAVRELGSRVTYDFADLPQQAETYLAGVHRQAQAAVLAAQQEAEQIRLSARQEAHEQGRREGLKESARIIEEQTQRQVEQRLSERIATMMPALAAMADIIRGEKDQWLDRWEQAAIRLSVAIAEKLLRRQLSVQPDLAAPMIAEALRLASGHPHLRIHLHPQDIDQLGPQAEEVIKTLSACADATLIADAELTRGGCRIETRHGEIDARLETMLARITEELLA